MKNGLENLMLAIYLEAVYQYALELSGAADSDTYRSLFYQILTSMASFDPTFAPIEASPNPAYSNYLTDLVMYYLYPNAPTKDVAGEVLKDEAPNIEIPEFNAEDFVN